VLTEFILRFTKLTQHYERTMIFKFINYAGKSVVQNSESIRMSNIN